MPGLDTLPPHLLPLVYGIAVVTAGLLIGWRYARARGLPPALTPSPDVVITGGALADRTSMQDLAQAVREQTIAITRLAEMIGRQIAAAEERAEREMEREHRAEVAELEREILRLRSLSRG